MAIFYYPNPSTQPSTSLSQYALGDYFVSQTGAVVSLTKSGALKVWSKYNATGSSATPNVPTTTPDVKVSSLATTLVLTQGQPVNTPIASVYGGSTVATSYTVTGATIKGYTVTVSPALPAGLSVDPPTSFGIKDITDPATSIVTRYNSATVTLSGTPTASVTNQSYTVTVTDASGLTGTASFVLTVNLSGAAALIATQSIASKTLTQGTPVSAFTPITTTGGTSPLTFVVSPPMPGGLSFSATGEITGTPTVYQSATNYNVTVTDSSSPAQTASGTFNLTIDFVPIQTNLAITTRTVTQGVAITSFKPVTVVSGGYGTLSYSISPQLPDGLSIDPSTGIISGTSTVSLTASPFVVTVSDSNSPAITSSKTFTLVVDPLPALVATLLTSTQSLTVNVGPVSFTPVSGSGGYGTLSYSISPTLSAGLSFNTTNGVVSGTPTALKSSTFYTVTVTDQASQTKTQVFNLTVSAQSISVTTNIASRVLVKNVSTSFTPVSGSGGYGTLAYSISPTLPTGITINTSTGAITGTPTDSLTLTRYTVTVTDSTQQSATGSFDLTVNNPATLHADASVVQQDLVQNIAATTFIPVSGSGGYGSYTYSISPSVPSGLSFVSTTGEIKGTPTSYTPNGTAVTYTVSVSDQAAQTTTNTFKILVKTQTLTATQSVSAITLTKGVAITPTKPVTAGGGTGSYTYSIDPSVTSLGLSFNTSTGVISGTPTSTSVLSSYNITVTDTLSQTASSTTSITINNPPALTTTSVFDSKSFYRSTTSSIVSFTPVTATGGYGSITFTINPSLPTGLSFASNGQISGIPSTLSTSKTYVITAQDAVGQTSSKDFALEVVPPVLTVTTAVASKTVTRSLPSSFTPVTYSGGTPPTVYTVSPSLPSGLGINSSTGVVSGTPTTTSTQTQYTVTVTDSLGVVGSSSFYLTVAAPASLTASQDIATVASTVGTSINTIPVKGSGGEGSLTYVISPSLPTGLYIQPSTGAVYGTPTVVSPAASYTVTVADTASQTASNTFSLTVSPAPLVYTVNNASLVFTQYVFSAPLKTITGSGGTGTLTYSISPSTLPAGLTFNHVDGTISGTPTITQPITEYGVTITDNDSQTTSYTMTLAVTSALPPTLETTLQQSSVTLVVGEDVNVTPVTGSSGFGTLTYNISHDLPSGLSFNNINGAITGNPVSSFSSQDFIV